MAPSSSGAKPGITERMAMLPTIEPSSSPASVMNPTPFAPHDTLSTKSAWEEWLTKPQPGSS